MKKLFLFLMIGALTETQAQNYQISFAGSGANSLVKTVKVENLTQCKSLNLKGSDTLHLVVNPGINEFNIDAENTMQIYPNPMTGSCTVNFEATSQAKTTIGLFDISGKRITQVQEFLSKGHHTYSLSGIGSGIYMLKIESDKFFYTTKIVSMNAICGFPEIKQIITLPDVGKQTTNTAELKSEKSLKEMQYNAGDLLELTGKSGAYHQTVFMLVPTRSQTVTFNFVACTDADSNHYAVVKIGTQTWMAQDINTSKYANGETIPNVTDSMAWRGFTSGARCYYNNDSTTFSEALYNWYAAIDSRNICPADWHVPADSEWTTLINYLGGKNVAFDKLRENCSTLWENNTGTTNSSGFDALPYYSRYYDGEWYHFNNNYGNWWTSSTLETLAFCINIDNTQIFRGASCKENGYSIRCVKN